MTTPAEEAQALQALVDDAQADVGKQLDAALRRFGELKADLTMDELLAMAEECGAEIGAEHCVNCAAWDEYVRRGGND